jgi:hypothetical protein
MENNGSVPAVIEGSIVKVEHPQAQPLAVSEYHRRATDVAGLVRALVTGKAVQIGPRKYIPVDAYQAVANAMGCVASARDVKRVEGGYTAIGEVKRLSDGCVVAEGEGFVGDDEPKWKNGPEYARRSMVQTRAIGRACRAAFAFVVPMIDLGLSSTPAEEMDGINQGTETPPAPVGTAGVKAALRGPLPSPPQSTVAAAKHSAESSGAQATHDRNVSFAFGKNAGVRLCELSEGGLKWYAQCFARDLADDSKANFHAKTRAQLDSVNAELAFRGVR